MIENFAYQYFLTFKWISNMCHINPLIKKRYGKTFKRSFYQSLKQFKIEDYGVTTVFHSLTISYLTFAYCCFRARTFHSTFGTLCISFAKAPKFFAARLHFLSIYIARSVFTFVCPWWCQISPHPASNYNVTLLACCCWLSQSNPRLLKTMVW
jgi:hypothetical protein